MRPLPPFNLRPVRKRPVVKGSMLVRARESVATQALAGRTAKTLKVRPVLVRAKPQLKVLGERTAC